MGERGVWVDQVTTLDPHPVDGIREPWIPLGPTGYFPDFGDATPRAWANTVFQDNYWRQDDYDLYDFWGQPVDGAFERQLSESALNGEGYLLEHSDTHLWYHGTVDTAGSFSNGDKTIPADSDWYDGPMGPRTALGFAFTRLVGSARPSAGLHPALGGGASRNSVDWSSATWPNLLSLDFDGGLSYKVGDEIEFTYLYNDYNSDSTVCLAIDRDRNPFNKNDYGSTDSHDHVSTGSAVRTGQLIWDTTPFAPDRPYYIRGEITDGQSTRYIYGRETITLLPPDGGKVSVVEVIDRSGSMSGSKMDAAKVAGQLFVDLMSMDDKIGVVSFASSANTDYPLTAILSDSIKTQAKAAIASLSAGGYTAIGEGVRQADVQLDRFPGDAPGRAMIVLSDGQHNTGTHPLTVIDSLVDQDVRIFTIGFGSDADQSLLTEMATRRNGSYYYAADGSDLQEIYALLLGSAGGKQQLLTDDGTINPDETIEAPLAIDPSLFDLTVGLTWPGSDLDIELVAPDGTIIDHDFAAQSPLVDLVEGDTYEFMTIQAPQAGQWDIRVKAVDVAPDGEEFRLYALGASGVTADVDMDAAGYSVGEVVGVRVTVDDGSPILGADVTGVCSLPSNPLYDSRTFRLYDDGRHGDGDADDGVYGGFVRQTYWPGTYEVEIQVTGESHGGYAFSRAPSTSFPVSGAPIVIPDLLVSAAAVNQPAYAPGEDITASFDAINLGSGATPDGSSFALEARISLDHEWGNSDDQIIGLTTVNEPLAAAQTIAELFTSTLATDTERGSYYLAIRIDGDNQIDEGNNEDNNTYWSDQPVVNVTPALVQGQLWRDGNGNGILDTGEAALPDWTIYSDTNGDGIRQQDELSTISADDGSYLLDGFGIGEATIRLDVPPGWDLLQPGPGQYNVDLDRGELVTGLDMALRAHGDLATQLDADLLPTVNVPGDRINVRFRVTNMGDLPLDGRVDLQVLLSEDALPDGEDLPLKVFANKRVKLEPGKTKRFRTTLKVPAIPASTGYLLVVADSQDALVEPYEANNVAVTEERELRWAFGEVDGRANVKLRVNDLQGTPVTFRLKGPGAGEVGGDFALATLTMSGTDQHSHVSIRSKGKQVTLGDVQAAGGFKQFGAKKTVVSGSFDVSGHVTKLQLGGLTGQLSFDSATRIDLHGDFTGSLTSTSADGVVLEKLNVRGAADGARIDLLGDAGRLRFDSIVDTEIYLGLPTDWAGGLPIALDDFSRQSMLDQIHVKHATTGLTLAAARINRFDLRDVLAGMTTKVAATSVTHAKMTLAGVRLKLFGDEFFTDTPALPFLELVKLS
ncbi:MAG: VWA domain-containing protein [Phycisphaerales bacterium JB038]